MSDPNEATLDWIHLSQGVEPLSLWSCLHDAYLRTIRSDILERSVVLEFESPHLQGWRGVPDDIVFRFSLTGVSSVRAATYAHWPGPPPDLTDKLPAEQIPLVEAYQAKWRQESASWRDFEASLATADLSFDVHHAELVQDEKSATIHLEGLLDGEEWYSLFLRASQLSVSRSDDEPFSLKELVALGDDYWEAFAQRGAQRQTGM